MIEAEHPHTGLNEHSGRYEYLAKKLVDQKFAVYALDHEGMGKSEGKRWYIHDWTNWVDDLHEYSKVCGCFILHLARALQIDVHMNTVYMFAFRL